MNVARQTIAWSVCVSACILSLTMCTEASSLTGFVETFDGTGDFTNISGSLSGLDNPGWAFLSDGSLEDGGFRISTGPVAGGGQAISASDMVQRLVSGRDGFSSRVVLRDVDLAEISNPVQIGSSGRLQLTHHFSANGDGPDRASILLGESDSTPPGKWRFSANLVGLEQPVSQFVDQGSEISLEIKFDFASREILFLYDSDLHDGRRSGRLGPFRYTGVVSNAQVVEFATSAVLDGRASALLDRWEFLPDTREAGDFNGNGTFDGQDINLLTEAVRSGDNELPFDLTADALVNEDDRRHWVLDLKSTYFGDANLDGEFASSDLINIFTAGEYKDGIELNSTWATGDWSGDGDFTTADLVLAFTEGGYEQRPRAGVAAVPEPGSVLLLLLGGVLMLSRYRGGNSSGT